LTTSETLMITPPHVGHVANLRADCQSAQSTLRD
jgi:hypothetical protein